MLERLGTADGGLDAEEASRRLAEGGPNAVRSHGARPLAVLARQLKNPLLLLVAAAVTSIVVGEHADAGIVLGIVGLSESLATQVLVIFIIRTRRVLFFHSCPSWPLLLTSLACVTLAALAPFLPTARLFGFTPLPRVFFVILAVLVLIYLGLVELGKSLFFRMEGHRRPSRPVALQLDSRTRRLRRLVTRWSRAVHAASPARTG